MSLPGRKRYAFLAVFKMEERKGWKEVLQAYVQVRPCWCLPDRCWTQLDVVSRLRHQASGNVMCCVVDVLILSCSWPMAVHCANHRNMQHYCSSLMSMASCQQMHAATSALRLIDSLWHEHWFMQEFKPDDDISLYMHTVTYPGLSYRQDLILSAMQDYLSSINISNTLLTGDASLPHVHVMGEAFRHVNWRLGTCGYCHGVFFNIKITYVARTYNNIHCISMRVSCVWFCSCSMPHWVLASTIHIWSATRHHDTLALL